MFKFVGNKTHFLLDYGFKTILTFFGVSSIVSLIGGFLDAAIIYMFLFYTFEFIFSKRRTQSC